jgi:RNA polymerase sigma-70 factor (ECF subfamily)
MDRVMEPAVRDADRIASPTESESTRLVERARRGEAISFEALLRPRLDGLFRTAWAILGDEADARDATQDACLTAWRSLPRLRDPARFDAWLMRVLVNGCRMRLRSRARIREIRMTPDLDRAGPSTDDPATGVDADSVARAFDRIGVEARTILVLHHVQHQPVATIAAVLGIPAGTVKSRLFTARAALAQALEREHR